MRKLNFKEFVHFVEAEQKQQKNFELVAMLISEAEANGEDVQVLKEFLGSLARGAAGLWNAAKGVGSELWSGVKKAGSQALQTGGEYAARAAAAGKEQFQVGAKTKLANQLHGALDSFEKTATADAELQGVMSKVKNELDRLRKLADNFGSHYDPNFARRTPAPAPKQPDNISVTAAQPAPQAAAPSAAPALTPNQAAKVTGKPPQRRGPKGQFIKGPPTPGSPVNIAAR